MSLDQDRTPKGSAKMAENKSQALFHFEDLIDVTARINHSKGKCWQRSYIAST